MVSGSSGSSEVKMRSRMSGVRSGRVGLEGGGASWGKRTPYESACGQRPAVEQSNLPIV